MTDASACEGSLEAAVAAAIRGGVDWVQVRDRSLPASELLALVTRLQRDAPKPVQWIVNRRVDVALAADADGVHLGFDGMDPAEVRALHARVAPEREPLIGVATHAPDEALAPRAQAATHLHLAPIFLPLSKASTRPPLGPAALGEAARSGHRVLAQGGIDASNARACIEAGAAGVAVTGEILGSEDPERAAQKLREAMERTR